MRMAMIIAMSKVWNKVYKSNNTFFGDNLATLPCLFQSYENNNVKKVLELGAGHGRDTIFFASNGIEVEALDYSANAVEILDKIAKEKRLPIKPWIFDVRIARSHFQMAILMPCIHICFLICGFH